MLLLLLLPLLLRQLGARDVPKTSSYVVKPIGSCPDVGYFFRTEPVPNSLGPGVCYLCFCHVNDTAVCWRRENRRCDVASYHHKVKKGETRMRRSPLGLTDIFFRDATRDVFNKNTPATCKPFESSFSEGCPPADWCIGCTVCDCDANGRWDCHVLSFCPDKEDNTKTKTAKKPVNQQKINTIKSNSVKSITTTTKKPVRRRRTTKATTRRPVRQIKYARFKGNKTISGGHKGSPKPLVIKKDTSTKKPIIIKRKPYKIKLNSTVKEAITQEVVKRVMLVMKRMFNKTQAINNQLLSVLPTPKVQKRSMDKKPGQNNVKKFKLSSKNKKRYKKHLSQKMKEKANAFSKATTKLSITNIRKKRQTLNEIVTPGIDNLIVNTTDNNTLFYTDSSADNEIFNTLTVNNYYKYSIVTKRPQNNSESIPIIYVKDLKKQSDNKEPKYYRNEGAKNATNKGDSEIKNNTIATYNKTVKGDLITLEVIPNSNIQKHARYLTTNFIGGTNVTNTSHTTQINKILSSIKESTSALIQYSNSTVQSMKGYNMTKVLQSENNKDLQETNKGQTFKNLVFKKINNIQIVLNKLLNDFRKNRTGIIKPRSKKINIMKYLKKIFRKMFRKRNRGKSLKKSLSQNTTTTHVIETICEIFGSCNKKNKGNKLLQYKVQMLNIEADTILRTIKIIKGLLHLFDFDTNPNGTKFKDDIQKLNFILKDQYVKLGQELTENQKNQIKYIKSNTQAFIQAVGRFANILSDLINILVKNTSKEKFNDAVCRRNKKKIKTYNDTSTYNVITEFNKLKNLLIKYNLVQNTFMKKIYEIVIKFDNSHDNITNTKVSKQHVIKYNSSRAIEHFSRNIIQNLRKLKNLAAALNSKIRRKRSTMTNDESVEYLLTLIEYLLKQNYPLNATPVNDGIDLLIEAIKGAPDIKPIKKKVLQSNHQNIKVIKTTEVPPMKMSEEDSSFNSNSKYSKEDNGTSSQWVPEIETSESPSNSFRENDFKFLPGNNIFEDTLQMNYYIENTTNRNMNKVSETTLSNPNNEENAETEISKLDIYQNRDNRKFEVYSSDIDDNDSSMETSTLKTVTIADVDLEPATTIDVPETDEVKKPSAEITKSGNQRTTLKWLDEGYDQEVNDVNVRKSENITREPSVKTFDTTKRPYLQKNIDGISSITQEFIDDGDKKRSAKFDAEEVMYKKQMELLNSLDYGTERSELEESEGKDDKEDVFASYYN